MRRRKPLNTTLSKPASQIMTTTYKKLGALNRKLRSEMPGDPKLSVRCHPLQHSAIGAAVAGADITRTVFAGMETLSESMGKSASIRTNSSAGRLRWVLPRRKGPQMGIMTAKPALTQVINASMNMENQPTEVAGKFMWEVSAINHTVDAASDPTVNYAAPLKGNRRAISLLRQSIRSNNVSRTSSNTDSGGAR